MQRPRVLVCGLGPAGPELVTEAVAATLAGAAPGRLFLRTSRHPAADVALGRGATSFDYLYEAAATFADVYSAIVEVLVGAVTSDPDRPVVYAVPGSPRVAEATVQRLGADDRVELVTMPGLSFLDLIWDRLGVDPLTEGVQLVDGADFPLAAAGASGPLVVAQCWSRQVLSDIKLALPEQPARVVILHHLGLADEAVMEVDWADLDRTLEPDHLTSLWVPRLAAPVGAELARLGQLVLTLRERCPWDREQTHASLTPHLIEESYEVVEAIEELDQGDPDAAFEHLEEELGDLLYQVFFHAALGAEEGRFDLADVARGVHDKLVSRHPHVFGSVEADSADAVETNWEQIKKAEKGRDSVMDGLVSGLPALVYAHKAQKKAATVGFDWPNISGPLEKVVEELEELQEELARPEESRQAQELGDLLFSVVNVARHARVDPEAALRSSTREFVRRFRLLETEASQRGLDLASAPPRQLDELWERAKEQPGSW
jgi:tetrapyrrole methylase family protein/MazG family protein